jgi:hypothetical protein
LFQFSKKLEIPENHDTIVSMKQLYHSFAVVSKENFNEKGVEDYGKGGFGDIGSPAADRNHSFHQE